MPALASSTSPRHIFHMKAPGMWDEISACSYQIAFGENDTLYRLGCDRYTYMRKNDGWVKLGERKATSISATNDSLWIVDWST